MVRSVVALLVLACCAVSPAVPCTPTPQGTDLGPELRRYADSILEEDLVFVGRFVARRQSNLLDKILGPAKWKSIQGGTVAEHVFSFELVKMLKGQTNDETISVSTLQRVFTCSDRPYPDLGDEGEEIIVFASRSRLAWAADFASIQMLPFLEAAAAR